MSSAPARVKALRKSVSDMVEWLQGNRPDKRHVVVSAADLKLLQDNRPLAMTSGFSFVGDEVYLRGFQMRRA